MAGLGSKPKRLDSRLTALGGPIPGKHEVFSEPRRHMEEGPPGELRSQSVLGSPGYSRKEGKLEEARVPLDSTPGSWDSFLSEVALSLMPPQCLHVVRLQIAVPRTYSAHTSVVPGPQNPSHGG